MDSITSLLTKSAANHRHLCPRQVLGVRIGMLAGKVLDLDLPQVDKRLFAFVESDGCGMGGIMVASGCCVERRTMRILDFGKLAATFVDTKTGKSIRIYPHPGARVVSSHYVSDERSCWNNQLEAYQVMPDEELMIVQPVSLTVSLEKIISRPGLRVDCCECGEEITNEREVIINGRCLCRACAGQVYFNYMGDVKEDKFASIENILPVYAHNKSENT
jgi:formylmethanofuran dehydrogenase subunit E